ncbi:MAG: FHA domain-containing protein [Myxococcota bacterium]|nr:FHA domain-containing protein [Myxococcota bacterium]
MFTVVVTEKGGAKQDLAFDEDKITIGRVQGNDVVLPRGNVSKRHAEIAYRNNQFFITDLDSTNGTYVNGRRITGATPVFLNDKIYTGDYILSVEGHKALEPGDTAVDAPQLPKPTLPPVQPPTPSPPPAPPHSSVDPATKSKRDRPSAVRRPISRPSPSPPDVPTTLTKSTDMPKATPDASALIDEILDRVSRQIKRIDRTSVPVKVDAGVAGQARIIISETVDDVASRGKVPPDTDIAILKGKVFRTVVDLGPLSAWLDDPDVNRVLATRSDMVFLHKGTAWQRAPSAFVSPGDMAQALRCLAAGREALSGGMPGVSQFRTEEGYVAFVALPPGAIGSPSLTLDKKAAHHPQKTVDTAFATPARALVEEAVAATANIGIVGPSHLMRLSVLESVIALLPTDAFVATLESLPLIRSTAPGRLRLRVRSQGDRPSDPHGLEVLIPHAVALDPTWLTVEGTRACDLPHVLAAGANRIGLAAELPLGATGPLDRELAAYLVSAGVPVPVQEAALLMEAAFDIFIVAERAPDGSARVDRILAAGVSDSGSWTPRMLYERKQD